MADIFLSYAREDRQRVTLLADALVARGLDVFWDIDVPVGSTWEEYIEARLDAARCVVVVWTEAAVGSKWVRAEAGEGREQEKLVPVYLDEVRVPLMFRSIQGAVLSHWRGDTGDPEFRRFLEAVAALLGGDAGTDPVPDAGVPGGETTPAPADGRDQSADSGNVDAGAAESLASIRTALEHSPGSTGIAAGVPTAAGESPPPATPRPTPPPSRRWMAVAAVLAPVVVAAGVLLMSSSDEPAKVAKAPPADGGTAASAPDFAGRAMPSADGGTPAGEPDFAPRKMPSDDAPTASVRGTRKMPSVSERFASARLLDDRNTTFGEKKSADLDSRIDKELFASEVDKLVSMQSKVRENQIKVSLTAARAALHAGKLTTPKEGSAIYFFDQVLRRDPNNAEALRGREGVVSKLVIAVDEATRLGLVEKAAQGLFELEAIEPGDIRVRRLRTKLLATIDEFTALGGVRREDARRAREIMGKSPGSKAAP